MLKIRRAILSDVPEITACVEDAYTPYIQRIGKPPAPMLEDYTEAVKGKMVWVVEGLRSEILGVLVLVSEAGYLLVENIAIKPGYQGRGYGRKLMEFSESEAIRMGYTLMRLYTNVKMVEDQAFYEHLGWKKIGRVFESGYERIYMEKQVHQQT
jgi:ribosomal protein S18 acetylase RimI-like enzyme